MAVAVCCARVASCCVGWPNVSDSVTCGGLVFGDACGVLVICGTIVRVIDFWCFMDKIDFPCQTFAHSMSYIFWKLLFRQLILAITRHF